MNSLLKSKEKPNTISTIYVGIIIFLILFLVQLFLGFYIKTLFLNIADHLRTSRNYSFDENFIFSSIKYKTDLINEIDSLKSELNLIKIENSISSSTASTSIKNIKENKIESRVVSKPPFSPYDFLVINYEGGEVYEGDDVFFNEFYIGKVLNSWKGFAEVRLFSSGDYKKEGILSRTDLPVVLDGRGGGNFYLKLPKDFDIKEGDLIKDNTLENKVIASVYKIDQSDGSFKDVYLIYPFSIFNMSSVYILKED